MAKKCEVGRVMALLNNWFFYRGPDSHAWYCVILFPGLLAGCAGGSTSEWCITCSTYVYDGHVYQYSWAGTESEKTQVAREYCAERGYFGETSLGGALRWSDGSYYKIYCSSLQAAPGAPPKPEESSAERENARSLQPISVEAAKRKCAELGLKPMTERFGECVLKFSK
jgi:hypothetical protein